MNNNKSLDYWFSLSIVLIPIFQYYISPLPPLNISTFLAVLFFVLFLFLRGPKNASMYGINKNDLFPVYIYVLFVIFNAFITINLYNYPINLGNIEVLFRFLLIFVSFVFLGYKHFRFSYAFNILEKVILISSFLMIIQAIAYSAHHPIQFHIESLLTDVGYADTAGRFDGLYMEPSHYAHAAILYLCIKLFKPGYCDFPFKNFKTLFAILGIFLSGSGQGYVFLLIVFAIWYFFFLFGRGSKFNSQKLLYIIAIIIIVVALIFLLPQIEYFQKAVGRFTDTDDLGGSALVGRTGTDYMFFELSEIQQIWGVGIGHQTTITGPYFTNSLYSHLITYGYVSLAILSIMFFYNFLKKNLWAKVFTLIFILELFFADTAAPSMMCQFLLFTLFDNNYLNKKYA